MPLPSPVLPSIEGLFISDAIDFNFKNNAQQPFFTFVDLAAPTGLQVITHLEFGRAAHRVAHILRPNRLGPDGQVVAIIALSDSILYQAIIVGCIIAGLVVLVPLFKKSKSITNSIYQPFPMSPRNSPAAIANLLEKTSCRRVLMTTATLKSLLESVRVHIISDDLDVDEVPSLSTAYPHLGHEQADHPFESFPGPPNPRSEDDLCIYIHSSGSTGLPKAIPQTHLALMRWALFRMYPSHLFLKQNILNETTF
ncbi:hypothetical protein C0991_005482 [Blastosporella zonata]|nr:hypothetical protein C0991_005482 [Blastosporella zonata]